MSEFRDLARDTACDGHILRELEAAEIKPAQHEFRHCDPVPYTIIGTVGPWTFRRQPLFWSAQGPGIPPADVEYLVGNMKAGSAVGMFRGFACGHFHLHTVEDLRLLADTIREIFLRPPASPTKSLPAHNPADSSDIRSAGWTVELHREYWELGHKMILWLFSNGATLVRGEGPSEADALENARHQIEKLQRMGHSIPAPAETIS